MGGALNKCVNGYRRKDEIGKGRENLTGLPITTLILVQQEQNKKARDLFGGDVNKCVNGYRRKYQIGKGRENLTGLPIATLI